jgi:hypothetical protein
VIEAGASSGRRPYEDVVMVSLTRGSALLSSKFHAAFAGALVDAS